MSESTLLCRRVVGQAIKDVIRGTDRQRADVLMWLATKDFEDLCSAAHIPAGEWKLRIAELFRSSPGMRMHYAKKMLEELA
jgi:hypothetical protein